MRAFVRGVRRELEIERCPLDTISEVFGLSDTELGRMFGVRRQAVAQWRDGSVPAGRAAKVATVASTAELLDSVRASFDYAAAA